MSLQDLNTFPGVTAQPDTATQKFVFNHTMLLVKDITKARTLPGEKTAFTAVAGLGIDTVESVLL